MLICFRLNGVVRPAGLLEAQYLLSQQHQTYRRKSSGAEFIEIHWNAPLACRAGESFPPVSHLGKTSWLLPQGLHKPLKSGSGNYIDFFFFFLPIEIVVKLYNGMRIRELMRKAKRRCNGLTSLHLFLASCPLVFFPVCWGVCEYHLAGGTRTEESVAALPHPYSPARFYLTVEKHYLHPFLLYHLFVTGLFIKSRKSPI